MQYDYRIASKLQTSTILDSTSANEAEPHFERGVQLKITTSKINIHDLSTIRSRNTTP